MYSLPFTYNKELMTNSVRGETCPYLLSLKTQAGLLLVDRPYFLLTGIISADAIVLQTVHT